MIDDQDDIIDAPKLPRRVPTYIAIPVVLACGLTGYAISLAMPLRPAPAIATAKPLAAEASQFAAQPTAAARDAAPQAVPARPVKPGALEMPRNAANAPASPIQESGAITLAREPPATKASARLTKSEPVAARNSMPAPVVETGSVAQSPEPKSAPNANAAPRSTAARETAHVEPRSATEPAPHVTRAQEAGRKRIRRVYRRWQAAPKPKPPLEQFWTWMTTK